jgi:[ribosomal protein S18]-alanine N-acetyltransferase
MTAKESVNIRKFRVADMHQVLAIEAQAAPKTALSREIFLSYAKSFPDTFIVLESEKDVAGYIIFDLDGHVHSTAVKPVYRRKGFGGLLFIYALNWAKKRMWLEVRSRNIGAIAFYKKLGLKIIGKIPNYYGNDDALVMVMK